MGRFEFPLGDFNHCLQGRYSRRVRYAVRTPVPEPISRPVAVSCSPRVVVHGCPKPMRAADGEIKNCEATFMEIPVDGPEDRAKLALVVRDRTSFRVMNID